MHVFQCKPIFKNNNLHCEDFFFERLKNDFFHFFTKNSCQWAQHNPYSSMITNNFEPRAYAGSYGTWMYFGTKFQQFGYSNYVTIDCWNLHIFHFWLGGNKFWVASGETTFIHDGQRYLDENLPVPSQGLDLYLLKLSAQYH